MTAKQRETMDEQNTREITIPGNRNAVLVKVKEQNWVAIFRGYEEIMRDASPGDSINFQLPPGAYTLRTDGVIEDVSFKNTKRRRLPGLPPGSVSALDRALIESKPIIARRSLRDLHDAPTLRDLPPDLIQRVLSYAEVSGKPGLGRETIDRIIETGELPDNVTLPPGIIERTIGLPTPEELAVPAFPRRHVTETIDPDSLPARLRVAVEAPSRHPVDNMPEVPADGKTACVVQVIKIAGTGQVLNRAKDNDEIYLRTTGGQLVDEAGKPVRHLKLSKGEASFRLIAETSPRLVTVSIFGPTLHKVETQIDFVHAD